MPDTTSAVSNNYVDVQALLQQLAELYRCDIEAETYDAAAAVLGAHIDVLHFRALRALDDDPDRFALVREPSGALAHALPEVDEEELAYVVQRRGASLVPIAEGQRPDVAEAANLRGRLLVPIEGRHGPFGVLVLYVALDEQAERYALEIAAHIGAAVASTLDRIRLLRATKSQSDLLDNVLESIPLGLIGIGLDDRVATFNRNAELLLGIQRFYVLKAPYEQVLPERLVEVLRSMQLMTLREQGTVKHELDYVSPEGDELSLGIGSSIIYDRDRVAQGVLFVLRDLALTREVEKLRKLDQLKDEFVHTVSHELKTPLTAILGGTEILMLDPSRLEEDQHELLGIVDDGARRLRTLINDLLDLSRLEGGGVELSESEGSLAELADKTIALLERRGEAGNCPIEREYEQGLPPLILDRDKIRQVLENLISNAIKYSPEGGKITVRIRSLEDGARQRIEVSDQGIGLAPDDLDKVFEKFYRVNATTTAEVEGTGLGLSITRHIVEMHDGEIDVSSTLGEGSTFSLTLPVKSLHQPEGS